MMVQTRPDNVVHPVWGSRQRPRSTGEAILEIFKDDPDLAHRFASACEKGAAAVRGIILDTRSALKLRGHSFATHDEQFEETGETLFELADELMPTSLGAVRSRIQERVEGRGGRKDANPVEAIETLVVEDYAAFDHLVLAAARGTDEAVLSAAKHLWKMLRDGGKRYEPKGFSEHVRTVLQEVFALEKSTDLEVVEDEVVEEGGWDADRAHEVTQAALQYIAEHTRGLDLDTIDRTEADRIEGEMWAAAEEGNLEKYIEAAREWARARRRAAEKTRGRG